MKAFAYRDGRIKFGRSVDPRAIEFCSGKAKDVHDVVSVLARHSRTDPGALYVPGIPEAGDDGDLAVSALILFSRECAKRIERAKAKGVRRGS